MVVVGGVVVVALGLVEVERQASAHLANSFVIDSMARGVTTVTFWIQPAQRITKYTVNANGV